MGPYQFVFIACMTGAPSECREVAGPIFDASFSRTECLFEAPKILEAWSIRNPERKVLRWQCLPGSSARL